MEETPLWRLRLLCQNNIKNNRKDLGCLGGWTARFGVLKEVFLKNKLWSRFDRVSSWIVCLCRKGKGKGKVFPLQAQLWPRSWIDVQLYSSMTVALEGGEWSAARPGCTLPPGKTRYPLYRRLGGSQGRSGRAENLAPPGFDPRTVQPVVSRYTNWATRPTFEEKGRKKFPNETASRLDSSGLRYGQLVRFCQTR